MHWLSKLSLEMENNVFFHTHILYRFQLGSKQKEDKKLYSYALTITSHYNSDAHILNAKDEID
jgi:hypothetical protein